MKKITIKCLTILVSLTSLLCFTAGCDSENNAHKHEYSITYSYDNDYHWFECDCGEDKEKSVHIFENEECVCGFKQNIHTHAFETYKNNSDNHWKECACGEKSQEENHAYFRKHNALSHWQECICGVEKDIKEHEIIVFNLQKDSMVNACTDSWYSQKEECLNCDYENLIKSGPFGHTYTNIRVGQYASDGVKATLIGDCEKCDNKSILVESLYALDSEQANSRYRKELTYVDTDGHEFVYLFQYNGVDYQVTEVFSEGHLLNGYGEIKNGERLDYEEIKGATDYFYMSSVESIRCDEEMPAGAICKGCIMAVEIIIIRKHIEINVIETKPATETENGEYTYNCAYEDCEYHSKKNTGIIYKKEN